eukprot:Nk52_evm28s1569 gene=Nk52_evmTU28s1569
MVLSDDNTCIDDVIRNIMCELNVTVVDTLLIAAPFLIGEEAQDATLLPESFIKLWRMCEKAVSDGKVLSLGVCDFDLGLLSKLVQIANVVPSIDQVNLESCCVIPKDLVEFSKLHKIQLLTHADSRSLFSDEEIEGILNSYLDISGKEKVHWAPQWLARYSVMVKCRGVVTNKGYVLAADVKE